MSITLRNSVSWLIWAGVAMGVMFSIARLERERQTVFEQPLETAQGQVTLYSADKSQAGPLVIVTHGFAGSVQMMQYISRDIARAGFTVAAFDFYGQGRSEERMSADVTQIAGTTMQLVQQTLEVTGALRTHLDYEGPLALVGHSMATDIIIRAAEKMPETAAIIAISMYSDAITPTFPERLLVLSGEWETRLRDVGRDAVAMVAGEGREGETAQNDGVMRRAVSVPRTEHVAVLFAPRTMEEIRQWLRDAYDLAQEGETWAQGRAILGVLFGLVVLIWPLSRVLRQHEVTATRPRLRVFFASVLLPIVPAVAASIISSGAFVGTASFAGLMLFFAVWGAITLTVLHRAGHTLSRPHWSGVALLLAWALGVFALALDRYAAAFLPTGPRVPLMLVLLIGTLPFMLADRLLLVGASVWQRLVARAVPVAALSSSMIAFPQSLGLLFTVLPVMVLFYLVYGTMARAISHRSGPETAAIGLAVILAWSIAASTPLFAG